MLMDTITFLDGSDWNYDVAGSTVSTPSDNDVILRFRAVRAFRLPTSLTGSSFYAETAPSGAAVITLYKNDVSIGTVNFASGSNTATITFSSDVEFAIGDRLEAVVTTANSIDEVYLTFKTLAT